MQTGESAIFIFIVLPWSTIYLRKTYATDCPDFQAKNMNSKNFKYLKYKSLKILNFDALWGGLATCVSTGSK